MQSEASGFLASNLAALSASDPALAARIERSAPNPALAFRRAKSGTVVPVLRGKGGDQPFHSMVDPDREAKRLVQSLGDNGFLVCMGLGGGCLPTAFLHQPQACGLLIIEKDAPTLRALMDNLPFSLILSDRRVRLTAGIEEICGILRSSYLPAICGGLASLPVRPWFQAESKFFDQAAQELRRATEEARADFGVQAVFGKRWFTNTILNLPASAMKHAPALPSGYALAHVTAAGPSLEESLPELAHRRDGSIILATDTSFPTLLKNGIQPEIVVSLDCQVYSYFHFLAGIPRETIIFFDMASPPPLVRRAGAHARFYASAHPFSRFISSRWHQFPLIDTTGGNVTHAAVSLARALGVRQIRLHGADFSYPRAKPYARGTYLFDHFYGRARRCTPLESGLASFVLGAPGLISEHVDGGIRYHTPVLNDYASRLGKLMAGSGWEQPAFDQNSQSPAWKEFLAYYGQGLRDLPSPQAPLGGYFNGLLADQKEIWATLLPSAASILHDAQGPVDRVACLQQTRQWALSRVERMISAGPQ